MGQEQEEAIANRIFEKLFFYQTKMSDLPKLQKEFNDRRICPYCNREMKIGAMGGGELIYGCYFDDCELKKKDKYNSWRVNLAHLSEQISEIKKLKKLYRFYRRYGRAK